MIALTRVLYTTCTLFLLVGLSLPPLASAQGIAEKGVVLGLNSSSFSSNMADDDIAFSDIFSRKTGFTVGGFVVLPLAGGIAVQPELLYTQKGATLSFSEEDEFFGTFEITGSMELAYVEVPVLLRYTIPTAGLLRPHLLAGPMMGFNISSKMNADAFGFSVSEDMKDETKSTELSLVFGGAVDYGLAFGRLSVGARYVLGLTNIYEEEEDNEFVEVEADDTITNRGLSLTVGLSF